MDIIYDEFQHSKSIITDFYCTNVYYITIEYSNIIITIHYDGLK